MLADAPKVAAVLIRNGADISQEVEEYPDLMPLYLTLPRSLASSPKELDSALRIACSYALPKTTGFILTRGANANTTNKYSIAAIHTAVMRRHPWRELRLVHLLLSSQYKEVLSRWESMLLQTVSTLLDFGANIDLRTRSLRTHECDPKCWRSIDCDHRGQTALHIASSTGILPIVSRLLDAGANPNLPDGQGYTALYTALVQGHKPVACHILKVCNDPLNPIVYIHEQTTALHVACRFSFPEMVDKLLSCGAYANVVDSHKRTPLHDVLAWARLDREEEVILTLSYLAKYGADPHTTANWRTPWQLAETHASTRVRDRVSTLWERTQIWRTRRSLSTHNLNLPKNVRTDVDVVLRNVDYLTSHGPGSSGIGRSRPDTEGSKLPQDHFPHLAHPGDDLTTVKTKVTAPPGRADIMLEKSGWAQCKPTHLAKGFKDSINASDQDDPTAVAHELFPKLIPEAKLNLTHTIASTAGIWSETKTAQLIKGLETQIPPPNRPPKLQQPVEAFPVLGEAGRISEKAVGAGIVNAEAAKFWGGLPERIGSTIAERLIESSGNAEEPRAETVGTKTGRDRNKRRWTPLRF